MISLKQTMFPSEIAVRSVQYTQMLIIHGWFMGTYWSVWNWPLVKMLLLPLLMAMESNVWHICFNNGTNGNEMEMETYNSTLITTKGHGCDGWSRPSFCSPIAELGGENLHTQWHVSATFCPCLCMSLHISACLCMSHLALQCFFIDISRALNDLELIHVVRASHFTSWFGCTPSPARAASGNFLFGPRVTRAQYGGQKKSNMGGAPSIWIHQWIMNPGFTVPCSNLAWYQETFCSKVNHLSFHRNIAGCSRLQ